MSFPENPTRTDVLELIQIITDDVAACRDLDIVTSTQLMDGLDGLSKFLSNTPSVSTTSKNAIPTAAAWERLVWATRHDLRPEDIENVTDSTLCQIVRHCGLTECWDDILNHWQYLQLARDIRQTKDAEWRRSPKRTRSPGSPRRASTDSRHTHNSGNQQPPWNRSTKITNDEL
eukprot:PhM_4_TR5435/c0_g1_i1/m.11464